MMGVFKTLTKWQNGTTVSLNSASVSLNITSITDWTVIIAHAVVVRVNCMYPAIVGICIPH